MGLYDSVDRGKPKPKRLTGPIALCCALFLLFGGLTYWACHHQFRFLRFNGQHARCAKHRDVSRHSERKRNGRIDRRSQ